MEQQKTHEEGVTPLEEMLELLKRIETAGETLDGTDSEYFEKKDLQRLLVSMASVKQKIQRTVSVLDEVSENVVVDGEGVFFVSYRKGERGNASYESFTVWADSESEAIALASAQLNQSGGRPWVFDQIERQEKGIIDCCTYSD